MKKIVLGMTIGIVLCSGIVYATGMYNAKDVVYNNEKLNVNNVNDALDELKNKIDNKQVEKQFIGTFTKQSTYVAANQSLLLYSSEIEIDNVENVVVEFTFNYINSINYFTIVKEIKNGILNVYYKNEDTRDTYVAFIGNVYLFK